MVKNMKLFKAIAEATRQIQRMVLVIQTERKLKANGASAKDIRAFKKETASW